MPDINKTISKETIERARFFQTVQTWPLSDELNYDGWLNNFKADNDKFIACLILDFFTYYSAKMVNQMLRASVGQAGQTLSRYFTDWKHSNFKDRCLYSFIPGETHNPSDSGHIFTSKLREGLGVPEDRIIYYKDIPEALDKTKTATPIILVDDFIGSGEQCDKAWNINKFPSNGMTLKEMSERDGHIFIYAPPIVNGIGYERISKNCPTLIISAVHILGPEYNLFDAKCICWKGDANLHDAGVELILRKSAALGIPSTNGASTTDEKGFAKQGLALSFEHGVPDAIPAFFYWCHDNWTPLLKKSHQR